MSQHYSDPSRADDPHALPDVEVFYLTLAESNQFDEPAAGWYYWYCFPGCMPSDDPIGPYDTRAAAVAAMLEESQS